MIQSAKIAAVIVAPIVFIVAMNYWIDSLARSGSIWQLKQAHAIASNATTVDELPREGWTTVALPNVYAGTGTTPTSIWYRLEVNTTEATNELWAVYLARPNANVAAFVNGRFIGDGGSMTPPVPLHITPLLLQFPGTFFHSGLNYVDVRSVRETTWSLLNSVHIGPDVVLAPIFRANLFATATVMYTTVVCLLMVGVMMAVLFVLRTRDAVFGWFAMALFFWAAHIGLPFVARWPIGDPYLRDNLVGLAFGGFIVCSAVFTHRFIGLSYPKREKAFALWFVFGAVVLILDPLLLNHRLNGFYLWVWFPPLGFVGAYPAWQLWRAHSKSGIAGAGILAAVSWFLIVAGTHDQWVELGWINWHPRYHPYTAGLVLVAFGIILLRRFVHAVEIAEHARDGLEVRIAEKSAALERNLVRLKDMERERALSIEREGIMRDMHDGVGGQLAQALSIAANRPELQPMEEPLRACLEELRLIVDSIEPTDGDLIGVLDNLRTRMLRRLTAAGVQIHWQVEAMPILANMGPQRVQHVTRIVQEAIANALKHAQANHIEVRVRALPSMPGDEMRSTIVIEIIDDGNGIARPESDGHGMNNMRRRAEDLAAQLLVDTSALGTTVRIVLPLYANERTTARMKSNA